MFAAVADELGHFLGVAAMGHGSREAVHQAAVIGSELTPNVLVEDDAFAESLFQPGQRGLGP
jgi:hypothetical protein